MERQPNPTTNAAKDGDRQQSNSFTLSAPKISLPKGGGAIRGMGEKFAANPVTGTGSMTVPIATSPARNAFGPQLSLSYDSGSGNGPFGFGWSLSLPSITRKTDKGLPQYLDGEESDVFILSGAEDLVPEFEKREANPPEEEAEPDEDKPELEEDETGQWAMKDGKHVIHDKRRDDIGYSVRRYRPRVEGLFARIERWTNIHDVTDVHWRSISRDNILTLYGRDSNSRIYDPSDPRKIFSWLICETRDDKGNAILYKYKAEDSANVDLTQTNERNRERAANRYIERIRYGNQHTLLEGGRRPVFLSDLQLGRANWLFEIVFDYGEGHYHALPPDPVLSISAQHPRIEAGAEHAGRPWPARPDPFSNYRAGFEVRTYRRCERVLMFHNFDELRVKPYLVRSTEFEYNDLPYSPEEEPDVEAELAHEGSTRFASFIKSVTQSGYQLDESTPGNSESSADRAQKHTYLKKSLPPLQFSYSKAEIKDDIRDLDAESLENLPIGLDGRVYQWVDLDGEGVTGILTEQASAWFYKPNLGGGKFGPMQEVARKPSLAALSGGRQQLLDLAGDGQLDLAEFSGPAPGFYERTFDEDWEPFQSFPSLPNIPWDEPNLRFIDLNGDGHADVLISEHEVFTWHPSMAEEGFGPAWRVSQPFDEEKGPHLVFADGTQSIYLADMCGDGLTALVRIRNGEVCYWPNLGYGRFGVKVSMDNAPWFDNPDQFNQQRIRLADIDGSGVNDIIYLHREGPRLYFNQSGNRWSAPRPLREFPSIDNLSSIMTADLLGNGTACLVWSTPLPDNANHQLRYIDLMDGQKPHLLTAVENNLGARTEVEYASSTKFYLADKAAGTPWVTKLPFPVHVVEQVVVKENWRETRFATRYSYHHGYFDGHEREFRGFGRVEQVDTEHYGEFTAGNTASPYITNDHQLYQPPVKTITWFHTGAFLGRERILSHFDSEYFPHWFEKLKPDEKNILGDFQENVLPEPDLATQDLSAEEWREALRACKGMRLRQEIYELDVDALEQGEEKRVKLFSTAYHNCHIQRLQPREHNRHAVFLVTESEAITYHYEVSLPEDEPEFVQPDPRIAHTLNLRIDQYGNVLESVAIGYPRIGEYVETGPVAPIPENTPNLIRDVQREPHLAYTENVFAKYKPYKPELPDLDDYRLPLPCEVRTYQLTGIAPERGDYYSMAQLRGGEIKDTFTDIPYHHLPDLSRLQKRCVEHVRTLYFNGDLNGPLPLGKITALGLPYETYKLALTNDLLETILDEKLRELPLQGSETYEQMLNRILQEGGYYQFLDGPEDANNWWIRSGIAGFDNPAENFYLPNRYTDPFGNTTELSYDSSYHLYIQSSKNPVGNETHIDRFDFRVLAPSLIRDINDNRSEVAFDILGLPTAMALRGKEGRPEGDNLDNISADLDTETVIRFFTESYDEGNARTLLGNATARHVYSFGEQFIDGRLTYGHHPACAASLLGETHVTDGRGPNSRVQAKFEYSDGMGQVLMAKAKAEGERIPRATAPPPLRWITSGKTVFNNKGKPVKQYEPYFSSHHQWDSEEAAQATGVTPILYYDTPGRLIRTESPDGSYSRVEFSPWHVYTYDQNDTVLEAGNAWYAAQNPLDLHSPLPTDLAGRPLATPQQRAAWLAAQHAGTPATVFLDSLGREAIAVAHNRTPSNAPEWSNRPLQDRPWLDEKYATYTHLDAEGKPLWIQDARGNRVMEYIKMNEFGTEPKFFPTYDIAGNLLFQRSMDGGDRWMLMDSTGQPLYAWDMNERTGDNGETPVERRIYHTIYDELRRPLEQQMRLDDGADWLIIERFVYGETQSRSKDRNLRGQIYQHDDSSGRIVNTLFDFKGNLLEVERQLISDARLAIVDWPLNDLPLPTGWLGETYTQRTEYDALNRMIRQENWHRDGQPEAPPPAVYEPQYNERGLLKSETLTLPGRRVSDAIRDIQYDAKGQRTHIEYGNDTITTYQYDPNTFRLIQLKTVSKENGRVFQDLQYTYDAAGNITAIRDDAQQTVFFDNTAVEPNCLYYYDALYRLIRAEGREHAVQNNVQRDNTRFEPESQIPFPNSPEALQRYVEEYQYDFVGNILSMAHRGGSILRWKRCYQYALGNNRLLATGRPGDLENLDNPCSPYYVEAPTLRQHYEYDTHGNMLNLNRTLEEYRLRWDHRDMIHAVNLGGGGWAYYNYDNSKQRTRKRIERNNGGNTVEERLYLGGMERYRRWLNGNLVEEIETHHLFVDDQRVLIVEDVLRSGTTNLPEGVLDRYQYGNHLGSVGLELDGDARIISYEEYHPYGTTAYQAYGSEVKAVAKQYRYTGMERDEESGLSYHTARYYLPWLGRWGSRDPVKSLVLNPYEYCDSCPVCSVDRDGKQSRRVEADLGLRIANSLGRWAEEATQKIGMIPLVGDAFVAGVRLTQAITGTDFEANQLSTEERALAALEGGLAGLSAASGGAGTTGGPVLRPALALAGGGQFSQASRLTTSLLGPAGAAAAGHILRREAGELRSDARRRRESSTSSGGSGHRARSDSTHSGDHGGGESRRRRGGDSRLASDRARSRELGRAELREALTSGTLTPRQREAVQLIEDEYGRETVEHFIDTGRWPEGVRIENSHPFSASEYPELARRSGDQIPALDHRQGVHGGDTRVPLHGDPRDPQWRESWGTFEEGLDEDPELFNQIIEDLASTPLY